MREDGEIIYPQHVADVVWEGRKEQKEKKGGLCEHPELTRGWSDLLENEDGKYSPDTKAKLLTLFQLTIFGDNGIHHERYGSKLGRNQHLASINSDILGIAIESEWQTLVLECSDEVRRIPLGFASGGTIIYPLNRYGTQLYLENRLPPHRFDERHLVDGDSFECAEAVFVGGALDLSTASALISHHGEFEPKGEPPLLFNLIWKQTLQFLPTRASVIDGLYGITLEPEKDYRLPIIVTAFSGKGNGEQLARDVGFVRETCNDNESNDRRYVLNLNDLDSPTLSVERRIVLLKAWWWFLHWSPGHQEEAEEIHNAVVHLEETNG